MSDSMLSLKPISDLLTDVQDTPTRFWIAAYQRGYRWLPLQVTQLLDDVWDFIQASQGKRDEFYCLQPLVMKTRPDGSFEVVDGQQRLTTILLILSYLNQRFSPAFQKTLYHIDFETRRGFDDFLTNPTERRSLENVDFFYIFGAIKEIRKWFGKKSNFINDIESALLNRTKVIWFQLSESDNPVDAFTRLNVGKIPLTNDELIRALFLQRTDADESEAEALRLQIAYEWDQLEKSLQSDDFWYFLNNQKGRPPQNRIGFLFDLVARSGGLPEGTEHDAYGIFYAYSKRLKEDGAKPKEEWLKIKKAFMMLEEWFEDRALYHIVGFLISEGVAISKLGSLSKQSTKTEFEQKLRQEVFTRVIGDDVLEGMGEQAVRDRVRGTLEDLEYGSDSSRIKSLLLLFNLATLLQSQRSNVRFQFASFKSERWDIEHIRSVTSDKPERHSERVEWLNHCLGLLRSQEVEEDLRTEIEDFIKLPKSEALDSVFDSLYGRLLENFEEAEEEEVEHGIANLTLLDQGTNRSYKNAVFAVKRQRLLSLDQAGIFVPLCTRNVFLKCYSSKVDNVMFWSSKDREAYREVILKTLFGFFTGRTEVAA